MFRISVASKFIDTSVESSIFYIQVITLIVLILTKDDDIYFNQKVKQEERYFKTLCRNKHSQLLWHFRQNPEGFCYMLQTKGPRSYDFIVCLGHDHWVTYYSHNANVRHSPTNMLKSIRHAPSIFRNVMIIYVYVYIDQCYPD